MVGSNSRVPLMRKKNKSYSERVLGTIFTNVPEDSITLRLHLPVDDLRQIGPPSQVVRVEKDFAGPFTTVGCLLYHPILDTRLVSEDGFHLIKDSLRTRAKQVTTQIKSNLHEKEEANSAYYSDG